MSWRRPMQAVLPFAIGYLDDHDTPKRLFPRLKKVCYLDGQSVSDSATCFLPVNVHLFCLYDNTGPVRLIVRLNVSIGAEFSR